MKRIGLLFFSLLFSTVFLFAQADADRLKEVKKAATKEAKEGWTRGAGIGLDFSQLALHNPFVGTGENRIAFGGIGSLFANYKMGKIIWDNEGSLQLAVQRLGAKENPFTKNMDILSFGSKAGYKLREKLYGALLFSFESILLKTYSDNKLAQEGSNFLQAQFMSPATVTLSPGLDYKVNDHFSVMFSPASLRWLIVNEDEIAKLGVHGNPWRSATDFDNIDKQFGANLKAAYKNTFYKKLSYVGGLDLYYNYLGEKQGLKHIDMIFLNDFGYELFKGLTLNLRLRFDWDTGKATEVARDVPGTTVKDFEKLFTTEALFIKYTYVF